MNRNNLKRSILWKCSFHRSKVIGIILVTLFIVLQTFSWMLSTSYESKCACEIDEHNRNASVSLAVIVPFRDRLNELLQFVPHMEAFLNRQGITHKFYIINQKDAFRFNRGLLINVGFLLSHEHCDYFVMHDVDLLPLNNQLSYAFPREGPFHVSAPNLHPNYHYDKFVGGVLIMQKSHFLQVNGFSNNYWGWGLEDDEFYARLKEANLVIRRPQVVSSDSSNTFRHIHDKSRKRDTAKLYNQKEVTRRRDRKTGLNTTRYRLLDTKQMTIGGIAFTLWDVALHCNHTATPWCERDTPGKPRQTVQPDRLS